MIRWSLKERLATLWSTDVVAALILLASALTSSAPADGDSAVFEHPSIEAFASRS